MLNLGDIYNNPLLWSANATESYEYAAAVWFCRAEMNIRIL
jgi:hypothetical protein